MKNYLIAFALTAISCFSIAQTPYHPVLAPGRAWDVFKTPPEMEICPYTSAVHLTTGGDTTVNGVTYKRLVRNHILSNNPVPFCGWFYVAPTSYLLNEYLLREDPAARKVYAYSFDYQSEYVLFDFTLQAGDTLKYPWGNEWPIDTVYDFTLANGEVRKRFQNSGFPDNAYVEGLGSLMGAFTPMFIPLEGWEVTTCVRDGDELLFSNAEGCIGPLYAEEFAPVGAIWHYTQPILNAPVEYSYTTITVTGDTVIGNEVWRVLKGGANPLCNLDAGFVRQVNDQVFFRDVNGGSFLLYDFGLLAGESYTTFSGSTVVKVHVDSIGTTTAGGQALKTWFVTCDPPFWGGRIVEKAGNLDYLIPIYGACDPLPGPIRCYADNDDFFKWVTYPCDTTFILAASEVFDFQSVKVAPNPLGEYLRLEIPGGSRHAVLFDLCDPTGRSVFRQEIAAGTTSVTLPLPSLPPAMYFWVINGQMGGRLVKAE
ncbi:MAG: hypothetical protein DYG98_21145 [Haliscomenobacteraceae bacterium CHB4]|nr:hypothetical protein [Saprospiraceae bacterium]MCE7925565.1 hypothetical protein [Haliscomenobacteraceae bacterium CHB4]